MNPFVHLHNHTHYSLLDGASKVPELCRRVKELCMDSVAVTDHGNLHGMLEFLREAKAAGIRPIVGMEAYCAPGHRADRSPGGHNGKEHAFHLTLLARTGEGVRNLMRLSSAAFLEGFYYRPRVDREILARHAEGLTCLSGCVSSEFSDHVLHGDRRAAEGLAAWYERAFGVGNFFVEVQCNGVGIQAEHDAEAGAIADRMGIPLVATSDAHYLLRSDAPTHDLLLCINTRRKLADPGRMRFETDQFFVRSPDEMYAAMPHRAEALARTADIAAGVEEHYPSLGLGRRQFPSFATPPGESAEAMLRRLAAAGLVDRYGPTPAPATAVRLQYELDVVCRMGFASYFLIVWDVVRFAREADIPNSARGSACGAVLSYALKISHVDPVAMDLIFERFLDPNRGDAPDIDLDLCKDRRGEVIAYVRARYGDANVAQIGTFGTMAAKTSVKDVGRALDLPVSRVEQVTRHISGRPNTTLDSALADSPELRSVLGSDPELARVYALARKLEGTARNVGTHAAGVVIAPSPLRDLIPLQKLPSKDRVRDVVTTQWEMGDVEKAGLLKMDFLGLRNLTSLRMATRMIEARTGRPFDPYALPLDDPDTFALLRRGEVKGVFQLDGDGIAGLLVRMQPDRFADVVAILALYRPGPLQSGMVDSYVNRKHRREPIESEHPIMDAILTETYGVICYQEQIMRILNRLAGIELSRAYACIKVISKKKAAEVARFREEFTAGAVAAGVARDRAKSMFDRIEYFGSYGFNKSHSTAYAHLAYMTAYVKAHHPADFMAALLTSEMGGADRDKYLVGHLEDCRRMGLAVVPPDVNASGVGFESAGPARIRFGLGAINGVGGGTVAAVVAGRAAGGPYRDLVDLFVRAGPGGLTPKAAEVLAQAGALDSLGGRRSQALAAIPAAARVARVARRDRARGQSRLFGDGGPPAPPDLPELPRELLLELERKTLGYFASGHPLDRVARLLEALSTARVLDLASARDRGAVILGGMISAAAFRSLKRPGDEAARMAKFTFEDTSGSVGAVIWPAELREHVALVRPGWVGFLKATVSRRNETPELVVSRMIPLARGPYELARGVLLRIGPGWDADRVDRLLGLVRAWPGNLDVYLALPGRAPYRAGPRYKVRLAPEMAAQLGGLVGPANVLAVGTRGSVPLGRAGLGGPRDGDHRPAG